MSPCHTYSYPSHLIVPQILAAEILTVLHLGCLVSIIYLSTVNFKGIETQIITVNRYFFLLAAVVLRGGVYQLSNPFHVLRLRKKRGIRLRDLNFTAEIISAGYRECGEGAADTWRLFVQLSHGDTRPWED